MIKHVNIQDSFLAEKILKLQHEAYLIEAELIKYYDIPPLKEPTLFTTSAPFVFGKLTHLNSPTHIIKVAQTNLHLRKHSEIPSCSGRVKRKRSENKNAFDG
jgi:hypothetical protein